MTDAPRMPHPEPLSGADYSAVELIPNNREVLMLDQRALPSAERYERFTTVTEVARAIRDMVVRGAPAIGIAAAYGLVLAARELDESLDDLTVPADLLRRARPTAVNLGWAVDRMLGRASSTAREELAVALADEARTIHREDVAACQRIGELGAELIPSGGWILTHCNAGALATGGYGTALGVVRSAFAQGKIKGVLADETRPYLQGARLTAWELQRSHIPVEVIADSAAGYFLANGEVSAVVVGSDRVARNGDVANKIGTYPLACLARRHGIPFIVAAPWSTVDLHCESGKRIPIEERGQDEITRFGDVVVAPSGVVARNPAFDVTPAELVSALVTERGIVKSPDEVGLAALDSLGEGTIEKGAVRLHEGPTGDDA